MGKFNIPLQSLDDAYAEVLGTKGSISPNDKNIVQLPIDKLIPFQGQPFRPYTPERLAELAEDIKQNGVLSPIIVRPHKSMASCYELLAGHNRTKAAKLAGLEKVPALVMNVDDATAILIMVNTNLNQRQELLPSEKAFAYKMQMDAIKCQGKRNDICANGAEVSSSDLCTIGAQVKSSNMCTIGAHVNPTDTCNNAVTSKSRNIIAENNGTSREQIRRYIRLTCLIKPLLDMVDDNTLPFRGGVELSYLSEVNQQRLHEYILQHKKKLSLNQCEMLRALEKEKDLYSDYLDAFFSPVHKEPGPIKSVKIKYSRIKEYFEPEQSEQAIEDEIITALAFYRRNRKS